MYKVLLADDEAIIREGLKCVVDWESFGFEIIGETSNGTDTLQFILDNEPDLVLLDIRMPKMLGLEVICKAREEGFTGKVIILSGYSDFKYAQEAIRYGIEYYLTKPIDEDELEQILEKINKDLASEKKQQANYSNYKSKAQHTIIYQLMLGEIDTRTINTFELGLNANIYQVVIYEKYSHNAMDNSYHFSDLLMLTNENDNSFNHVTIDYNEVLLLKGEFCIRRFNDFLSRYHQERRPQKGSPLDSIFITYGRPVERLEDVRSSYLEADRLLQRRFFCDNEQHTIGYTELPDASLFRYEFTHSDVQKYATRLIDYIQSFNRNMVAETLHSLENALYNCNTSINSIKLLLSDMYIQIKEAIHNRYSNITIHFLENASVIEFITGRYYLYEIILFLTEQFEMIMSSIGNSSRDSVLNDVIHYIDHNYTQNITLENIAPLFGYNSSYLGKIFSKKMGENFNSYVDHIRIEQSKELLVKNTMKVYEIAEMVGYRNVDYFHLKFKKYTGSSPAEYRKTHKV